jgi:hypothetical protein
MSGTAVTTSADNTGVTRRSAAGATKTPVEGELRSFAGATAWLYSRAVSAVEFPIADGQFEIEFLDHAAEVLGFTS